MDSIDTATIEYFVFGRSHDIKRELFFMMVDTNRETIRKYKIFPFTTFFFHLITFLCKDIGTCKGLTESIVGKCIDYWYLNNRITIYNNIH